MDEYEFGSPRQKSQHKAEKVARQAIAGVTDPGCFDDLMDAYSLSLHRIAFRRAVGKPLGFEVRAVFAGVLKVTNVMAGHPVAKTSMEEGMYLISIDGRRVKSEAEFKEIENSKRRVFRMALAKKRPAPYYTTNFPLPFGLQRKHGYQYFMLRLDPTDGVRVGTAVGERAGVLVVTRVLDGSAGQYAGVIKGDRVLAIDGTAVENQKVCMNLVQQSMGNPLDIIIERAPGIVAPPIPQRPSSPVSAAPSSPTSASAPKPVRIPTPTPTSTPVPKPVPSPPSSPRAQPVDTYEREASKPSNPMEVSIFLDPKAKQHVSTPSTPPPPPTPANTSTPSLDNVSIFLDPKAKPKTSSPKAFEESIMLDKKR